MGTLKVSSQSNPNSVAGAIANVVRQSRTAYIQVIGAGALNQAVKAIAVARGFLAPEGIDLVVSPAFADVQIDGQARTALRLSVGDRHATVAPEDAQIVAGAEAHARASVPTGKTPGPR